MFGGSKNKQSPSKKTAAGAGIYYGCSPEDRTPQFFRGDEHFLLIGPTRSGKGRSILAPNLILDCNRSALVIDPKGELAAWTANYRITAGHEVVFLDPFGELQKRYQMKIASNQGMVPATSHGFNPLLHIDPDGDDFVDECMGIAEALVTVESGASEKYWSLSARDFVAGVIMHEILYSRNVVKEPVLNDVRTVIALSSKEIANVARMACEKFSDTMVPNKLAKYKDADSGDRRDLASILAHAQSETNFLDSKLVADDLERGTFDFSEMKNRLITVYLVIPATKLITHAKWLRLVINSAIRALQRTPKKGPDVLFMLDEFPQLGRLEAIETSLALNAGYGIKIFSVVQHLNQLVDAYGKNWETFLSGGVIASFAPRDYFTSEHLSKLSGQEYRFTESVSVDGHGNVGKSRSPQLLEKMLPHELRQMPRGDMAVFVPTVEIGQKLCRTHAPDFTKLPDVKPYIQC